MPRWLERRENDHGEWSVTDTRRLYLICAYDHARHRGAHLHHPAQSKAGVGLEIRNLAEAVDLAKRYAKEHDVFDIAAFRREYVRWRSLSKNE